MKETIYEINVRPEGAGRKQTFRLFNRDAPAGHRLYKGESKTHKNPAKHTVWPFPDDAWMVHPTRKAAEEAAVKLQTYLDRRHQEIG